MKLSWPLTIGGICFLFLLLSPIAAHYFISGDHEERLIELEERLPIVSFNTIDSLSTDLKLDLAKQKLEVQALRNEVDRREEAIRNKFFPLLQFGIPLTLLGLFGFGFGIYKYAIKEAMERAQEEIDRRYTDPKVLLFRAKKVQLFAGSPERLLETSGLLNRFGINFEQNSTVGNDEAIKQYKVLNDNKSDVFIIASDKSDGFTFEAVDQLLQKTNQDAVIFVYGGGIRLEERHQRNPRIGSARLASQMYGNLLNLLSIQQRVAD